MNKLKYYRKLNKLTQKDVANYLHINQPNYANIENNKVKLNFDYANLLASLYNIKVSDLINDNTSIITITKKEFEIISNIKDIVDNQKTKD